MSLRVYLDTSVISALHDPRMPDRQALTQQFWEKIPGLDAVTSEVGRMEVGNTPDPERRAAMLASLAQARMVMLTPEMHHHASALIQAGIFSPTQDFDALHVAAAVLSRCDVLVSWNFKHLVNRRRRAMVNALNVARGAGSIDIISPPEI